MKLTEKLYPLQKSFNIITFIVICGIITATDLFIFALIYVDFCFWSGKAGYTLNLTRDLSNIYVLLWSSSLYGSLSKHQLCSNIRFSNNF